jgi:hypothetical protein
MTNRGCVVIPVFGITFTPAAIFLAVRLGPDSNFRGISSPLGRTFTWVSQISIASIFISESLSLQEKQNGKPFSARMQQQS